MKIVPEDQRRVWSPQTDRLVCLRVWRLASLRGDSQS